jgi:hypothetical protein
MEKHMTKLSLLGAAVILSSALAGPAMAQQVISNPGYCAQFYPNANCQNKGPGNPYTGDYQRRAAYHDSYNRGDGERRRNDFGFWPGDVAAGVAGAAVGTAGAIAAPTIGGEAYARQNGFVCVPGTWFRGEDGRRHICQ